MVLEDEKIIDLYWERSESAITETDKKYRSRCIYVARSVLNDISDAEECLNDTYLTAWNLMPPERPKFLSSFLFKIVRNHSLNKLRFNNNSRRKKDISFSTEELEECVDGNSSVEDKFDESEVVNAINEFLESLKKDRRYIFVRRYWYLDSIADIAGHCSMTEDNVMKILSRTRMQLKEYLKGRVG
ncbi:RNA polymerase sigma factor [Ruminococcus sp. HUN007]|uniref:RNA polymerase sigma factor n=1 Tax=Ruminococcus sp. HUN007 TaxID=1514668 RepID=UPI000678896F|nr:RNA polymerase sigma factor [Ruminococcus sp. HUN007]